MPKTLPMILQWDESFDIGSDTLTGVNDADYKPPFAFTGRLNKLTLKLDRPQLTPEDIKKLEAAQQVVHHAVILEIQADSFRQQTAKQRSLADDKNRPK